MNVVLTGASTGIGRATALRLAGLGHRVFAGIRDPSQADAARSAGLTPLWLDVTDAASIGAAVAAVASELGEQPLHGLVNNAGVGYGGPIEHLPLDRWREQLEVNLLGPIAMIRAFLPLLRRGPGRVVNVSSISGKVTLPMMGPYCASKHALEAVSDALRLELAPQGIAVVVVEPGAIATPMWGKARERLAEGRLEYPEEVLQQYREGFERMERIIRDQERAAIPPERVAGVIADALLARRPPLRVLVGSDARLGALAKWLLPTRWFDALLLRA